MIQKSVFSPHKHKRGKFNFKKSSLLPVFHNWCLPSSLGIKAHTPKRYCHSAKFSLINLLYKGQTRDQPKKTTSQCQYFEHFCDDFYSTHEIRICKIYCKQRLQTSFQSLDVNRIFCIVLRVKDIRLIGSKTGCW